MSKSFGSPLNSLPPTPTFKKSKWTPEEDKLLIDSVKKNGMSNWTLVAGEVQGRTGKQCRERWTNQLCPALNKDSWTRAEDEILIKQQRVHGNFWSKISRFLPGRSANAIKNRWGWLSRHGVTASCNPQMMYPPGRQAMIVPQICPPMPQIYQMQQTAPMDFQWQPNASAQGPGSDIGNFVAFSEPNAFAGNVFPSMSSTNLSLGATDDENEPSTPQPSCDLFTFNQADGLDTGEFEAFGGLENDYNDNQIWGDENF